jgi:hypothetical protein
MAGESSTCARFARAGIVIATFDQLKPKSHAGFMPRGHWDELPVSLRFRSSDESTPRSEGGSTESAAMARSDQVP